MKQPRSLAPLVALLAAAALFDACSCGNKCGGVSCPQFTVCNGSDGLCYCGGINGDAGKGTVACGANERCDGTLQSCVSSLCDLRDGGLCSNGTTCDPADGQCKCGARICPTGQLCDPERHLCLSAPLCEGISCAGGQTCDVRDGRCKCNGTACGAEQQCVDGGCQADPCFGVSCSGQNNGCFSGQCRCGSADGPACNEEQFCDGTACRENSICANVACEPGTVCGALDGFCHCGSVGGPICRGSSTCVLYLPDSGVPVPLDSGIVPSTSSVVGRCLGGDLCAGVQCASGEVCESATGRCLCGTFDGGTPPVKCGPDQICGHSPGGDLDCLTICNPYGAPCPPLLPSDGGLDASVPQSCFYEASLAQLLCEPSGLASEGDPCGVQSDCSPGYGCATPPPVLIDAGAVESCRQLCSSFDGGSLGCNTQDRKCFPVALIPADGGSIPIGACWPPPPADAGAHP